MAKLNQSHSQRVVIIALGCNVEGDWGPPPTSLQRALEELDRAGVRCLVISPYYRTAPVGGVRQPAFLNIAVAVQSSLAVGQLLRLIKKLERMAGRRVGVRWGPRPLDVDIIHFRGQIMGNPSAGRRYMGVVLPHPEAHRRAFVLAPLNDVAPHLWHPRLGQPYARFLHLRRVARQSVQRLGYGPRIGPRAGDESEPS